jgi:hypothetical protein
MCRLPNPAYLSFSILAVFASNLTLHASTLATSTASAGTNTCKHEALTAASCNVSAYFSGQPVEGAQSSAAITATGLAADLTVNGLAGNGTFDPLPLYQGANATATAQWSIPLIITGASGTGDLVVSFFGNGSAGADCGEPGICTTYPFLQIAAGVNQDAINLGLQNPPNGDFSLELPVMFNSGLVLTTVLSTGQLNPNGYFTEFDSANVQVTGFEVTNTQGLILPGARLTLVPEPKLMPVTAGALMLLAAAKISRRFCTIRRR